MKRRVIGDAGILRYLHGSRPAELVRLTRNKAVEGEVAVEAPALEIGVCRRIGDRALSARRRHFCAHGLRAARQHQPHTYVATACLDRQPLDARSEAFADQVKHESVRRGQNQGVAGSRFEHKGANPRIELLRGEFLLKPPQALVPEVLHLVSWPI